MVMARPGLSYLFYASKTDVFEAHETAVHRAGFPVLIGYVRVSKVDGSQVLDHGRS
jgi:hypothetical protein